MFDFGAVTPDGIREEVARAVESAETIAARIADPSTPGTFDDVIAPFDDIIDLIRRTQHHTEFMKEVHPDPDVREAGAEAEEILKRWWQFPESPWSVELAFRPEIFAAVERFAAGEEAAQLTGERARFLETIRADMRLVGHHLAEEDRAALEEMSSRLIVLQSQFSRNIADDETVMLIGEDDLDGLPESYVKSLGRDEETGSYVVTMAYPDYVPFMENSGRRDLREKLHSLYANRAVVENRPLLEEAVDLRRRMARLLGFESWADRVLSTRMARSKDRVDGMYQGLIPRLTVQGEKEIAKVAALLEQDVGDRQVQVWDWNYYDTQIRKTEYGVDPMEVAEYLPLQQVLDGMFQLTSEVFGLVYRPVEAPTWHPDVLVYQVTDRDTGVMIGHFYLDLFPRQGKFTHAAVFPGVPGKRLADGSYQTPIAAMVCNFTKPTEDTPSLLQHSEVETLFHEFGHVLHDLVAHCELARFSGAYTVWDFVEAPSQIMEHWTWKPEVLTRFARHHQTGQPIPTALVEGLVAARQLNDAMWHLRQIQFGLLDQALHGPEEEKDLDAILLESTAVSLLPHHEGTFHPASFGHLMGGGYDAAYYGYIWSEVFGDDMFSRFEEEGITSPQVGRAYRDLVIGKGGSVDPDDMLVAFLGREPNNEAFLRKVGIE
ncbi:MAG TPA: M3 family metallopeptidase [Acidimicrobiia bacterium]|nr:M3 family metallopeptidase [Acidimicrobiia bacterium]